jgi:hypothetical protein
MEIFYMILENNNKFQKSNMNKGNNTNVVPHSKQVQKKP